MAERFVFDAPGVEALEAGEREWRAWDEALPGFGVRVRPSGTKSWIVRARTRGADGTVRRQRVTLGRCGEMSLEEARAQARKLLGAGVGAAAVEDMPAADMAGRASRGRGDGIGGSALKADSGCHAAAGSPAEDDGIERKSAGAAGKAAVGGDRPGAGPAADMAMAKTLEGIRSVVDRIEAWSAKMGPQMETLSGLAAVTAGDRRRRKRRWVWAVLAAALAAPLVFAGGAFYQSREPILPQADPALGWKDHVWNYYGETFMGCFRRAKKTESGYADCTMKVRAR